MQHPLIGIPAYPSLRNEQVIEARQAYVDALVMADATPILLPPTADESAARRLLALCSGLLLIGGGDLETCRYHEADSGKLTFVSPERDRIELQYTAWALAANLPILGICRGIQTLNVAAGGSLIQDIPSEVAGAASHAVSYQVGEGYAHVVEIKPGTLLARQVGFAGDLRVNSHHHQAVGRIAQGFIASAAAPDGVVEAIELPGARYVLGVQWHPEGLMPEDAAARAIFRGFVEACY
ncbi:MAG: gamma-glutamyl-gamma-aminobutyrate hydrolase family protein [Chloroflexi bacterium]|nr:gamma-glutamyl-gamma-aminobutyrate hydrolase family protein [Chloroflexota bacterium]